MIPTQVEELKRRDNEHPSLHLAEALVEELALLRAHVRALVQDREPCLPPVAARLTPAQSPCAGRVAGRRARLMSA